MEQIASSTIYALTALIILVLLLVSIVWWMVFVKDYIIGQGHGPRNKNGPGFQQLGSTDSENSHEVWATSLMLITFLCLICETGLCVDPFARFEVWDDGIVRTYLTITVTLLLIYLLIATDATVWLNYITLGSLLIKPRSTLRYALYISCLVFLILSFVVVFIYAFDNENSRGIGLGWLLASLLLVVYSIVVLLVSLRDINLAVHLGDTYKDTLDLDGETFEEEKSLSQKTVERSWQLVIYLSIIGFFLFVDLCRGVSSDRGGTEMVYFMYELGLKILILIMLLQRKPIGGYFEKYRPFTTFKSGDTSSKTVYNLKTHCERIKGNGPETWNIGVKDMKETATFGVDEDSQTQSKVEEGSPTKETDEPSLKMVKEPKDVAFSNSTRGINFKI